ncbi:MAG: hypothetical protein J5367_00015 [Lachnospiraceae bacterium]|nr:hypothetical protein [Lachnospiraceae bacterium]
MKNEVRKNTSEYIMPVIFFGLCVIMLAGYLLRTDDDFSDMENRFLQKRPKITGQGLLDGSFMDSFETYTNEQIPLRNMFVKCKAVSVWLTGSSENDGIAKGKDSYLFDKVTAVSDKVNKNITAIKNFAMKTDRDIYVAIAPTSTWINEEKLPKGMPVLDELQCSSELALALRDIPNAHMVSLYDALEEHKDEQLYYRTDHHWTTKGAGYAYEKIASEMGLCVENITQYEKHEANDFYGTHYAKYKGIFVQTDEIEYYDVPIKELELEGGTEDNLIDTEKLSGYDKYAAFMYGNDGRCVVHADKGIGKNLYIFKDSYANCLIPYLIMNYDNITVIDLRYFGGSVADELAADKDADVLLLYNWTFVNEDNHFYKLAGK